MTAVCCPMSNTQEYYLSFKLSWFEFSPTLMLTASELTEADFYMFLQDYVSAMKSLCSPMKIILTKHSQIWNCYIYKTKHFLNLFHCWHGGGSSSPKPRAWLNLAYCNSALLFVFFADCGKKSFIKINATFQSLYWSKVAYKLSQLPIHRPWVTELFKALWFSLYSANVANTSIQETGVEKMFVMNGPDV